MIKYWYQELTYFFVFKGDFKKAYYLYEFRYLIKRIINTTNKNSVSFKFWRDQGNESIKENINKYRESNGKEKNIHSYLTNSDDILKNKKVYLMINRYQGTGIGIEHDVARTYVNTAKQVGINLKHIYTDNFPFESDCMIIENDLNAFKPDYLIMYDSLLTLDDEAEKQKWLSFLKHIKDKFGVKLIVYSGDSHTYGAEKNTRFYFDTADKVISMSSWTPLNSVDDFQYKLGPMQYFTDENLFFPKLKEIDVSFMGVEQSIRAEIITFAAFVASKLKLKTKFHIRRSLDVNKAASGSKIVGDETYLDTMRKTRAVINIGMKGTKVNGEHIHVINGRVAETIASGAALIQYKPKDDTTLTLNNYYTPWKEYLPFSNSNELKEILYLLKYEPDIITEIAHNGRQKYLECYNSVKSWENILKLPIEN